MSRPQVTVIRGGLVLPHPGATAETTDLVIVDGLVDHCGPYQGDADTELDATGCLVLPGLVNAHVRPGATPLLRGLAEDLDISAGAAFFHRLIPLRKLALESWTPEESAAVVEWDAVGMLLGGATTIIAEYTADDVDVWADVATRLGFRTSVGLVYPRNLGASGYLRDGQLVRDEPSSLSTGFELALGTIERIRGRGGASGTRIDAHLAPHGPDSVPEWLLRETRKAATELTVGIHLHVAQTLTEIEAVRERTGRSSVEYLEDIGFLGADVLAVHTTHASTADWRRLAGTDTTSVICPYRKAKEGFIGRVEDAITAGARLAIGSDSYTHDLVEDMRLGAMLGKQRTGRMSCPSAPDVLTWATAGGAAALGDDRIGHLRPGAHGDVLVIDLNSGGRGPLFDPVRALVYYGGARDIRHSLVAGQPVVRDGSVVGVDMTALAERASRACTRVWSAARERNLLPDAI